MIHNVYFWLKPDLSPDDITRFEAGLLALGAIDCVQSCTVGRPAATPERPVTDKSFSYHLGLTFSSIENHDIYQDHPDHHVFVDGCRELWDKVIVYDSESIG